MPVSDNSGWQLTERFKPRINKDGIKELRNAADAGHYAIEGISGLNYNEVGMP